MGAGPSTIPRLGTPEPAHFLPPPQNPSSFGHKMIITPTQQGGWEPNSSVPTWQDKHLVKITGSFHGSHPPRQPVCREGR